MPTQQGSILHILCRLRALTTLGRLSYSRTSFKAPFIRRALFKTRSLPSTRSSSSVSGKETRLFSSLLMKTSIEQVLLESPFWVKGRILIMLPRKWLSSSTGLTTLGRISILSSQANFPMRLFPSQFNSTLV